MSNPTPWFTPAPAPTPWFTPAPAPTPWFVPAPAPTPWFAPALAHTPGFIPAPSPWFTFECTAFAEGRFRRAYKGIWASHPRKQGQQIVVKESKDNTVWDANGWSETVKVHKRANFIAKQFNRSVNPSYPIMFTEVQVQRVLYHPNPNGHPKLHEYVTVEDYLLGNYKKWCNNYGYISQEAKSTNITTTAFMHWSWLYTNGQEMVGDVQGVYNDSGYHLTDPAILSLSGSYGITDTGIEGMAMFFLNHECNDICRGWNRPNLSSFRGLVPQSTLTACQQLLYQVNNSTTYKFEMKFPPLTKQIVTQVFLQIACNC